MELLRICEYKRIIFFNTKIPPMLSLLRTFLLFTAAVVVSWYRSLLFNSEQLNTASIANLNPTRLKQYPTISLVTLWRVTVGPRIKWPRNCNIRDHSGN